MANLIWLRIRQNINFKRILLIELILIALFFLLAKGFLNYQDEYKESQKIIAGIDNQDKSVPANMLVNNFKNTEHFSGLFKIVESKQTEFKNELKNGKIDAAIILPNGFTEALYHFENKPIKLITKTYTPIKNSILEGTLSGYSKYVKAVDIACKVYNEVVEKKEKDIDLIDAYEKGITVELLAVSLNRANYFEKKPLSMVKLVSSIEYYSIVVPFSFLAFISLIGSFKRIKEKNLSIQKRIKISGTLAFKQLIADYIAESFFVLVIFCPLIIYKLVNENFSYSLKFLISIVIANLFFSSLWKALSQILKTKENILIFGISVAFLNALVSGAVVPYVLLSKNIKNFAEYSINFNLTRYSMGMIDIKNILIFLVIFITLFLFDLSQERVS